MSSKKLCITGKGANPASWPSAADVAGAIASWRFDTAREKMSAKELVAAFGDWSPIVRGWAAEEVGNRPEAKAMVTQTRRADSHADALAFHQRLRDANRVLGCDFFEGVVMKRADSAYPVQLRSAPEEFRGWAKHRFLT